MSGTCSSPYVRKHSEDARRDADVRKLSLSQHSLIIYVDMALPFQ